MRGDARGTVAVVEVERRGLGGADVREPLAAQIVLPALQDRSVEVDTRGADRGDLLVTQLVLECLGGSCDDRPPARQRDRDEVGERLADTCACLDDEVPVAVKRFGDARGHELLALSSLCGRQCARHAAEGVERRDARTVGEVVVDLALWEVVPRDRAELVVGVEALHARRVPVRRVQERRRCEVSRCPN